MRYSKIYTPSLSHERENLATNDDMISLKTLKTLNILVYEKYRVKGKYEMKYEGKSRKNRDAVYETTVTSLNMYKAVPRNLFFVLVCSISSFQISPKKIYVHQPVANVPSMTSQFLWK